MSGIEFRDVSKRYGDADGAAGGRDISFEVAPAR